MSDLTTRIDLDPATLVARFERLNGGKATVMAEVDRIVRLADWDRASAIQFIWDCVNAGATRVCDIAPLFAACRLGYTAYEARLKELCRA